MSTLFLKGDLLHTEQLFALAFGAPADGRLEAGVAVAFAKHFPGLAEAYGAHCNANVMQPGDVFTWEQAPHTVYILATHATTAGTPKLAALARAVDGMLKLAEAAKVERVGVARLGAGSLDWRRVKRILDDAGARTELVLMVFEQFVRATPTAAS